MRLNEKIIPYLIVIIPLALVLTASFFITSFYLDKVGTYFNSAKERSIKEHVDSKKTKSELWAKQLNLLFDYKYNRVEENLKKELKNRVDTAYKSAIYIYRKYKGKKSNQEIKERIIDALGQMSCSNEQSHIFISDYNGNSVLSPNQKLESRRLSSYADADGRSMVLEEIQTVRKRGEGFLRSRSFDDKKWQRILVKDLSVFDWFIGSSIDELEKIEELKTTLLGMLKSIPIDSSDFMSLYDDRKNLFISSNMKNYFSDDSFEIIVKSLSKKSTWHKEKLDGYYYYSEYYKPLGWYLVYGFDISSMSEQELSKQKDLETMLDKELEFIVKVSASIVFFVVILTLLLSRKINEIFKEYQDEVQKRTDELKKLNLSLEKRVQSEVKAHTEKEKMLVQQSKMAEMGDMLSMIAHQWRQPLNQMSYVFMNVESAYEYDELNKKYLEEKLKEGTDLLEFMSVTIDDFRNYFRPDKAKEFVLVSEVIKTSVTLIKNSLDMNSIEIELHSEGRDLTHIYKNEFIQVILNLIKNAKDILIYNSVENPKITINSTCQEDRLVVEICDNGGGVDEDIKDKIFEPYFSTKDKKSGTGLGLYMSKMIIEEHLDGKLSVQNRREGACFKIEL
ncbi:MAG: cache domain-containing protein [Campylobacterota bacterium]|nr:cache domain-containing protein [Campylobacterota bacterium]